MKMVVFSQYYYPERFRINDLCDEWAKSGHDVTVVTGIPNYPEGSFYSGYGWNRKRKEIRNGVKIVRLPIISRGKSKWKLSINYLSFVVSGFFWSALSHVKADLIFCFGTSPMTQAIPAVQFAKRLNIPLFHYVQDLWPENFQEATGIKAPLVINAIARMAINIYNNSERIFVTSRHFIDAISGRGISTEKIVYWPQYAEELYRPSGTRSPLVASDDRFTVVFTGNIGTAQGLSVLPEVCVMLRSREISIRFLIVGSGRGLLDLRESIQRADVSDYFEFIPHQPPEMIPSILSCADVGFVSFANKKSYAMTLPAKVQSYMACGMPILAAAEGETEEVVQDAVCGLTCQPGDPVAIAHTIELMSTATTEELHSWGSNAKRYADIHFDKRKLLETAEVHFLRALHKMP